MLECDNCGKYVIQTFQIWDWDDLNDCYDCMDVCGKCYHSIEAEKKELAKKSSLTKGVK